MLHVSGIGAAETAARVIDTAAQENEADAREKRKLAEAEDKKTASALAEAKVAQLPNATGSPGFPWGVAGDRAGRRCKGVIDERVHHILRCAASLPPPVSVYYTQPTATQPE